MTSTCRSICRVTFVGLACFALTTGAQAQTPGAVDDPGPRREVSGIAAGYGALAGGGPLFVRDALWGVKVGDFPSKHFGTEFTLEQSIRMPAARYVGGDFVVQFPKPEFKGLIPFAHLGAGAFLYGWSHAEPALSFGGGIKQYITERVGVRVGIQDRMAMRYPSAHRLDFYGGVVFRF